MRSGLFFALMSTAPIEATIIRLTIREITVAVATPITPQFITKRKTALSIKLMTFPIIDAQSDCFV